MPATNGPETHARLIPAGSKLVFQMHYTPNGAETTDQSEAGLVFADPKHVAKQVGLASALNWKFQIPPCAADYKVEASYHIPQDVTIYSLTPHMHWRGKSFRFTAIYPDKSQEVLLDVPRYDFNWQNTYLLAMPKFLPDGTDVVCKAHFDNSANNPVNPDPTETVRWGDQTFQEMVVGSFFVSPRSKISPWPAAGESNWRGQFEVKFRYRPQVWQKKCICRASSTSGNRRFENGRPRRRGFFHQDDAAWQRCAFKFQIRCRRHRLAAPTLATSSRPAIFITAWFTLAREPRSGPNRIWKYESGCHAYSPCVGMAGQPRESPLEQWPWPRHNSSSCVFIQRMRQFGSVSSAVNCFLRVSVLL